MKTYIVQRVGGRVRASVLPEEGRIYPLKHLLRHSPDGFEYGYGGSGPSDLARSIVGDLLGEKDPKPALYRPVTHRLVAQIEGDGPVFISEDLVRLAMLERVDG